MRKCPQCGDQRSRFSHRNAFEKVLGFVLQIRPYRCRACMRRYWWLAWDQRFVRRYRHLLIAGAVIMASVVGGFVYLKTLPYEAELPRAPGERPAPPPTSAAANTTTTEDSADENTLAGDTADTGEVAPGGNTDLPGSAVSETLPSRQADDTAADSVAEEGLAPALPPAPPFEASALRDQGRLVDVITASDALELHVLLVTDAPPRTFQHFRLLNPERLVIDIQGRWDTDLPGALNLGHPLSERLRIGVHEDMVRVVFELTRGNIEAPTVQVRADGLALVLQRY